MTRDEAKQLLPIVQAYAEGKTIEYYSSVEKEWVVVENPAFGGDVEGYRIKTEPKYRPFKDVEECWQEMQKHQPFGWLKSKKTKDLRVLYKVLTTDTGSVLTYHFKNNTFADGEPFGIKEERV